MISILRIHFLVILLILGSTLVAQDIIVRTNGAQISAKVLEITDDSVKYKSKTMSGNPVFSISRNEVKLIEYWNGKKEYLQGSYLNMSENDSSTMVTGVKAKESRVYIEGIQFHIERLFTEYHLILDYTYHPDTNFIASKGKIEFEFENGKDNFFVKYYPTAEKTSFAKFLFNETGTNKRYSKLSNKLLTSMVIFYDDSVSRIVFEDEQSLEMKEMFSGKDISYEP